jgi:LacI family transcriptional regulator
MVVPDITSVFFASLLHCGEALAERDGFDLLIVSSSEERRRVETLITRRIDGLIVVPASDDSMALLKGSADGPHLPPTVLLSIEAPSARIRHGGRGLRSGRLRRGSPPYRPWTPRHRHPQ